MKTGLLYSGGKDSSLAALLLSKEYEVELNTFVFQADTDIEHIVRAAETLELKHYIRVFRSGLLKEVLEQITSNGFPNTAIQMIHREALAELCNHYKVIADGTRFGDRVPLLSDDEVRSISDTYGCSYIRPLLGFPKREVERLAFRYFDIEFGETGTIDNGDYEREIREELVKCGLQISHFFPPFHQQSLITAKKARGLYYE